MLLYKCNTAYVVCRYYDLSALSCLHPFREKSKKTSRANERDNDLHSWKNSHHRHNDAEDKVEADEGFVLGAVIRLCVEYIEQNHSSKGTDIVHQCERQQGCGENTHTFILMWKGIQL